MASNDERMQRLVIAFVSAALVVSADRVYLGREDAIATTQIMELQKYNDELRKDVDRLMEQVSTIRQQQIYNEGRINTLERIEHVTPPAK